MCIFALSNNNNMKIAVYEIITITPRDENELHDICDILDIPSLKHGTAQFINNFSHFITKSVFNKTKGVDSRYYDRSCGCWRHGILLAELTNGKKMFAEYPKK